MYSTLSYTSQFHIQHNVTYRAMTHVAKCHISNTFVYTICCTQHNVAYNTLPHTEKYYTQHNVIYITILYKEQQHIYQNVTCIRISTISNIEPYHI